MDNTICEAKTPGSQNAPLTRAVDDTFWVTKNKL